MKLIVCGPPHSGKSVFMANLMRQLPFDYCMQFRACPDGEGQFSNNHNQDEVRCVRRKTPFSSKLVDYYCKVISSQPDDFITLIDVGGKRSKENEQIFKQADSFLVISSDSNEKQQWLEWGNNFGLNCIACIDSSLEGHDEIYETEPYVQGKITGLERGNSLDKSHLLHTITSSIVEKSNYKNRGPVIIPPVEGNGLVLDNIELGRLYGYTEIIQKNGYEAEKLIWPSESVSKLYDTVSELLSYEPEKDDPNFTVGLHNIRANFVISALARACKENNVPNIQIYDAYFRKYRSIKTFPQEKNISTSGSLNYYLFQNQNNAFLHIYNTEGCFDENHFENCVVPEIENCNNLYVSAQLPYYVFCSIINSYEANNIYTMQPGKGFTCIYSKDRENLGKFIDTKINPTIDGMNIQEMFKEINGDDKKTNLEKLNEAKKEKLRLTQEEQSLKKQLEELQKDEYTSEK